MIDPSANKSTLSMSSPRISKVWCALVASFSTLQDRGHAVQSDEGIRQEVAG